MKRFVDTEIFEKEWFMDLEPRLKVLTQLIFLKCDAVGVWDPNWKLASFYVGEKVSSEDLNKIDQGQQFEILEDGKVWIPDFCKFQYGDLKDTNKPHLKYISMLREHGLLNRVKQAAENSQPSDQFQNKNNSNKNSSENIGVSKGYGYPLDTPQEKDKEKEKEEDKGGSGGKEDPTTQLVDPDTGKIPHDRAKQKLKQDDHFRKHSLVQLEKTFHHHVTEEDWHSWIDQFFQDKALEPDNERDGMVGYQRWFINWLRMQLKYQAEKGGSTSAQKQQSPALSGYGTPQKNLPYMKNLN